MDDILNSCRQDASKPPLLLFPEGTCVNNEYAVMFKRGAFDLDATIIPVGMCYDEVMNGNILRTD